MELGMNNVFEYFVDELHLRKVLSSRSEDESRIWGNSYLDVPHLPHILEAAAKLPSGAKILATSKRVYYSSLPHEADPLGISRCLEERGDMPIAKGIIDEMERISEKYNAGMSNARKAEEERKHRMSVRMYLGTLGRSLGGNMPQWYAEVERVTKEAESESKLQQGRMKGLIPPKVKRDLNPGNLEIGINYDPGTSYSFSGMFSTRLGAKVENGSIIPADPLIDGISRNLDDLKLSVGDLTIAAHEESKDPTFTISVKRSTKIDERTLEEAKNLLFV